MKEQFPALIVTVPLLSSFIVSISGWIRRSLCFYITLSVLILINIFSFSILNQVIGTGVINYRLGGWEPPWGIAYHVDHLNALMLCVISVVSLLNLISTKKAVERDMEEKRGAFYTLYTLMITGLLGITITGDAFNLYVLLEIASLTGYGLIAIGEDRAVLSSLNYLYMGTIGACFYLLGIGYLYIITGSLNMIDISHILPSLYNSKAVMVAFVICMVGLWIKMALFPLHGWLPNAYTHAYASSSSLIAPLMTKVMVYVMLRVMFSIFTPEYIFRYINPGRVIVWLSISAIFFGAVMALSQKNIKRMFTFIIVSEIGYMVGGAWIGNRVAFTGCIFHMVNDALMTLGAFLFLGILSHNNIDATFEGIKGLTKRMPFTMGAFILCALSFIGVPPTSGFFSKWYLLLGAMDAGYYGFMLALIVSSLINVILFFRIIESAYFYGHDASEIREAELFELVPLFMVVAIILIVGLLNAELVQYIIDPAIPKIII